MKWEKDQSMGFFGYHPRSKKTPAQPLHAKRVDLDAALEEAAPVLALWSRARLFPEVPAFSGGLLDSWPKWALEGLSICRQEEAMIDAFERMEVAFHG